MRFEPRGRGAAGRGRASRGGQLTAADDRALRPALEAAVAVGRSALAATPAEKVPSSLRPVLRFARLNGQALASVRKAVEGDDAFRARVAATVDEATIGRLAWLWLARPAGWEVELAALTDELRRADDESAATREVARMGRTLATLEAAVAAAEQQARERGDELDLARAQLADAIGARSEAEAEAERLQAEVARLGRERSAAVRAMKELEAADAASRGERRQLRLRIRALEAEVAATTASTDQAPPVRPAPEPAPRVDRWDRGAVARAVADAAQASADLARALEAAAAGLAEPSEEAAPGAPRGGARPSVRGGPPSTRPARRARRRAASLPTLVADNSVEAVNHLLRLPHGLLVVDGYNISMAAWPGTPITDQRQRLIDALRELHARTKVAVVVVFDGDSGGRRPPGVEGREVRVLFTGPDEIADDRIVALVEEAPPGRPILVVTSDRELQDRVRAGGARAVTATPFLAAMGR